MLFVTRGSPIGDSVTKATIEQIVSKGHDYYDVTISPKLQIRKRFSILTVGVSIIIYMYTNTYKLTMNPVIFADQLIQIAVFIIELFSHLGKISNT